MRWQSIVPTLKQAVSDFSEDKAPRLGAAFERITDIVER